VSAPSDAELRRILAEALRRVAPEADVDALAPDAELREELEIDSIDVLNLAIALHEATGIDIPERDYAELATLARGAAYLRRRLAG
jgi:acyl carrier protein